MSSGQTARLSTHKSRFPGVPTSGLRAPLGAGSREDPNRFVFIDVLLRVLTDATLMKRFQRGDPEAVRAIYRAYSRPVFTVAYGALGDRSLAEEAVQVTFTKAWQAADRFDASKAIAPWLYTIARRVAVDLYRRERRHESSEIDHDIAVMSPSFEGMWEAWEIRAALDKLPAEERTIIQATHYRQLTMTETATEFGIPVGTVKSRSHRAYRRLAQALSHLREETA